MNEEVFRNILGEALERELAEYNNVPEHKFSFHHKLAMKRILSVEKPAPKSSVKRCKIQTHSLKRSLIIAAVLVFLAVIVGAVVVFRSERFSGTVYDEYTRILSTNIEGSPKTIEYRYALASVPEGYEVVDMNTSQTDIHTVYEHKPTGNTIVLRQWVKNEFSPNYNTEHHPLEEVNINGNAGLCIDFGDNEFQHVVVVWDNGDYIIEIYADLDKKTLLNLAETTKIENK